MRENCAVPSQSLLHAITGAVVRVETKHMLVMSGGIPESEARDQVVIVERRQRLANDAERFLIRIGLAANRMQAPALKRILPRPVIALGKIDPHDQIRRLQPGLA